MIRKLFSMPQTALLLKELDHPHKLPEHEKVVRLLGLGADPWARIQTDTHHNKGRPLFEVMLTRCPYYEAVDAWIAAAGNLAKAPWEKHKHPSPLLVALANVSQTDLFKENVANRLLDKGCSLKGLEEPVPWADARSVIQLVMMGLETPVSTRVMNRLVETDASILRTPRSREFLANHPHPDFHQWGIELDAAEIDAATPPVSSVRRGPRL